MSSSWAEMTWRPTQEITVSKPVKASRMSLGRVMSPTMISTERDLRESMKGDLVKRVFADV